MRYIFAFNSLILTIFLKSICHVSTTKSENYHPINAHRDTSNKKKNLIGVPPIRLGPCRWLVDSKTTSVSTNINSYEKNTRKDTTAGLLQIPCSVVIEPSSSFSSSYHHSETERTYNDHRIHPPIYLDFTSLNDGNVESIHFLNNKYSKSLSAFIDTGAQVTVMPLSTARRLHLDPYIDRRYAGQATGVGTVNIIGKIPNLTIILEITPSSSSGLNQNGKRMVKITRDVTILGINEPQSVDLLIGLDILKGLNACIDLKRNYLKVNVQCWDDENNNNNNNHEWIDIIIPFVSNNKDINKRLSKPNPTFMNTRENKLEYEIAYKNDSVLSVDEESILQSEEDSYQSDVTDWRSPNRPKPTSSLTSQNKQNIFRQLVDEEINNSGKSGISTSTSTSTTGIESDSQTYDFLESEGDDDESNCEEVDLSGV